MIDSFARRTGLVAIGQSGVKVTQLVVAVFLVRMLSPTEWTETAYLLSIYLAALTIGTFNLHQGILFFIPRIGPTARRALIAQTALLLAAIGAVIAVGLAIAAPLLSGGRLAVGSLLPWLGLAIVFELPAAALPPALIACGRFGLAAGWDLLGTAMLVLGTTAPAAAGHGAAGVVAGVVAVGTCRLLLSLAVIAFVFPGSSRGLSRGTLRAQLRFGIPLGITLAVSVMNRLVDKWFVAAFDSANFGIYAIAAQEIPLLSVLPYAGGAAIVTGLVDAFRLGDLGRARFEWVRLTASMSLVVVPVASGLILAAPELMSVLFTSAYAEGVLPFQIFTAITLHRVAEYGLILRAAGRNRDLLVTAALTLTANVVLAGIGAITFGMTGAALGTMAATVLGWWFVLGRIAQLLDVGIAAAFAWSRWLGALGLALVGFTIATGVAEAVGGGDVARMAVKLVVFGGVYLVGVRLWKRPHRSTPSQSGPVLHTPDRCLATGRSC